MLYVSHVSRILSWSLVMFTVVIKVFHFLNALISYYILNIRRVGIGLSFSSTVHASWGKMFTIRFLKLIPKFWNKACFLVGVFLSLDVYISWSLLFPVAALQRGHIIKSNFLRKIFQEWHADPFNQNWSILHTEWIS